ncbi:hypothetical protein BSK66_24865 [Paenibacillus odorifer]|jgi:hypothetical protein|uniref:hypothetical protein n=1 Tax=Paenibacillus TaxID=44249 RepID=UPI0003E2573D|nr:MULTISPECIES: hypothetical protein [Paenibacillus]ETT54669.1 hypothetical protein C171_20209 [Paenibacillus sp. FSL H8-237]OME50699.1 hypothetical protein BSK66_24865 [Paenibacillus odorifer]
MLEKLQSAAPEEAALFYSGSAEENLQRGCIGHLRGDFGRSGEEFWMTWFTRRSPLQTPAFDAERGKVIQAVVDQGVIKNLQQMLNYCNQHPEARITSGLHTDMYGFCMQTQDHRYYLRCFPYAGDYNFYLYCYARPERLIEQARERPSMPVSLKKKPEQER